MFLIISWTTYLFYSTYLWTRQQAIAYTKLFVLGWDGYSPGLNNMTDRVTIQRCFGVHHKVSCFEDNIRPRYCVGIIQSTELCLLYVSLIIYLKGVRT